MTLLELQKIAEKNYGGGEALGECEYFNQKTGEPTDWHPGDILQWFVAVEIAENYDDEATEQVQLATAIKILESGVRDLQGAIGALRQKQVHCRYCEHLKDVNADSCHAEYVGMCEFQEHPITCGKFQLASCLNTKK